MLRIRLSAIAIATLIGLAAASTAGAMPEELEFESIKSSGCPTWVCGTSGNGTQLTGIALPNVEAKRPLINRVTLPSGEIVNLR
jgi:hypothetical protein